MPAAVVDATGTWISQVIDTPGGIVTLSWIGPLPNGAQLAPTLPAMHCHCALPTSAPPPNIACTAWFVAVASPVLASATT